MNGQPFLVLIGGVMGSGKTTLGARLLSVLEPQGVAVAHVDIDDVARESLPPLGGPEAYRRLEDVVRGRCATGYSLIVSATMRERADRERLVGIGRAAGYVAIGVFLHPPIGVAIDRAVHREEVPGHAHLLSAVDAAAQIPDWMRRFSTDGHSDLLADPWGVYGETPTIEELLMQTQERIREAVVFSSPEWEHSHPTVERW